MTGLEWISTLYPVLQVAKVQAVNPVQIAQVQALNQVPASLQKNLVAGAVVQRVVAKAVVSFQLLRLVHPAVQVKAAGLHQVADLPVAIVHHHRAVHQAVVSPAAQVTAVALKGLPVLHLLPHVNSAVGLAQVRVRVQIVVQAIVQQATCIQHQAAMLNKWYLLKSYSLMTAYHYGS